MQKEFHEIFSVEKGSTLHLNHGDGKVTIKPWKKNEVDIQVSYRVEVRATGGNVNHDFDVEFRKSGRDLHVNGHEQFYGFFKRQWIKRYFHAYTISAPAYLELDLKGEDGDVIVSDWKSNLTCRLEDGSLKLSGLKGDLSVYTEDGRIRVSDLLADTVHLNTEDGHIAVTKGQMNHCRIVTEDGNVELERTAVDKLDIHGADGVQDLDLSVIKSAKYDIRSDDGTIKLTVPASISADISARTGDGSIRTNIPDAFCTKDERNHYQAQLGSGAGKIRLRTSDGQITLKIK